MEKDFVLVTSFERTNIQDRLWYAQDEAAKERMLTDKSCNLLFGDKVWIITNKKLYILGSDRQWYPM